VALGEARSVACLQDGTYLYRPFSVDVRLLLLVVLAFAAVALGATYEPHGGCDYDFGADNGTAYLVVNNPYNLKLSLNIIYQIGERKNSTVLNVLNTRVIAFCGLGHGWLYIQQHASPLRSPLALYPLAVPRYLVLRAGESATITAGPLFAPATAIAVAIFLLVAIALRPKLGKWAVYATPEPLRSIAFWSFNRFILVLSVVEILFLLSLFFTVEPQSDILERIRVGLSRFVGHISDVSDNLILELIALVAVYVIWSLGGFYLTFYRINWIYVYLSFGIIISISLFFILRSLLFFLVIIFSITSVLSSSIILILLYGVFMSFLLLVYGASIFIYYDDMNFGLTVSWNLPFQIPAIGAGFWIIAFPLLAVFIVEALLLIRIIFDAVAKLKSEDTATFYPALLPPLWWWFGLGIFALSELTVRSFLHRLSTSRTITVDLSRGRRAVVVSADLYGMYLCKYGGATCDDVEWVRYGEVKFKVSSRIKEDARDRGIRDRFSRKVVLPIFAGVLAFCVLEYTNIYTILSFILFLGESLRVYYKYGYLREMKEYIRAIMRDKGKIHLRVYTYLIFLALLTLYLLWISGLVMVSALIVIGDVMFTAIIVLFLLRADPELSRYLFPWLELRLMYIDGLVIALARGGCLQWAKGEGVLLSRAFVIRDGDCLVVVSPYVENVKSRLQRYLCGPACPPVRVVIDEELQDLMNTRQPCSHKKQVRDFDWRRVAVGILNLRKCRYYYYIVDFPH